jgi:acyl-CoA synthetase (AMP-forming)/AMP-acid ligase II
MPTSLAIAAPVAAASLAYLNARTQFFYDYLLMKAGITKFFYIGGMMRRDRVNLFYLLESRALSSSHGSHVLLIFEGKTYTYRQLYDTVLQYAAWLKNKYDIKPREIVAMDFQNSDTFVFVWWAIWALGAVPAFVNYNLTGAPLVHCLKAATTRLCLIDPNVAANVTADIRKELSDINFVDFTPDLQAEVSATSPARPPDSVRSGAEPFDLSILIYTSGTTGLPKPAVVSWGKCCVGSNIVWTILQRRKEDIMYTSMPLYHSSASLLSFVCTLWSGSTQALGRKFSTKIFWKEVRESKATMIQYVGETLRYLLSAPPQIDPATGKNLDRKHHVRLAFGNGLRPDIWHKFKERFGIETIAEFYAATEGTFGTWNVSNNDFSAGAIGRMGSLYRAYASWSVALVDVDHTIEAPWRDPKTGLCKRVETDQPGEMIIALPKQDVQKVFQGYYNNPKATEGKIIRDVFSKGDAWFRTGDIVRWDKNGLVFFHDRIGDTFRWKAENVSTAEVSEAVGRHPTVREANVYGVQLPHHDGRAGCAALTLDRAPDAETLRSLAAHVCDALPRYSRPLFVRISLDDGSHRQVTGTNKQQKHVLSQAGVRPSEKDAEMGQLYWLDGDSYVPFSEHDWRALDAGQVKL